MRLAALVAGQEELNTCTPFSIFGQPAVHSHSQYYHKTIAPEIGDINSLMNFFPMHKLELYGYGTKKDMLSTLFMEN